jgi:hypothetical protein
VAAYPKEFEEHVNYITRLSEAMDDEDVRLELLDAIETLVHNMNGPWKGCRVAWPHTEVPDTIEGLF